MDVDLKITLVMIKDLSQDLTMIPNIETITKAATNILDWHEKH